MVGGVAGLKTLLPNWEQWLERCPSATRGKDGCWDHFWGPWLQGDLLRGPWAALRTALVGAACTLWSPWSLNVHAGAPSLAETTEIVHIPLSALFLLLFLPRHPSFEEVGPGFPRPSSPWHAPGPGSFTPPHDR